MDKKSFPSENQLRRATDDCLVDSVQIILSKLKKIMQDYNNQNVTNMQIFLARAKNFTARAWP